MPLLSLHSSRRDDAAFGVSGLAGTPRCPPPVAPTMANSTPSKGQRAATPRRSPPSTNLALVSTPPRERPTASSPLLHAHQSPSVSSAQSAMLRKHAASPRQADGTAHSPADALPNGSGATALA